MKIIHKLLLSVAIGIGLAAITLFIFTSNGTQAAPTIRYVIGTGGTDIDNDCTNSQLPCQTISHAIFQANDGDIIQVAYLSDPEVYKEPLTITKDLILQGGWHVILSKDDSITWERPTPCEAKWTTIDAEGKWRVITINQFKDVTIDCFVITGGDGALYGGGIYADLATPIIINNIITGNFGTSVDDLSFAEGGGIYLSMAPHTAVISGNLIANNTANALGDGRGGGIDIYRSDVQILSNTIQDNLAGKTGNGGGVTVRSGNALIANNQINHNIGSLQTSGGGGGIYAIGIGATDAITIENNQIEGNIAINGTVSSGNFGKGGGIYISGYRYGTIRNNTIRENTAATLGLGHGNGGGIYATGIQSVDIQGNTIDKNIGGFNIDGYGGGVYLFNSDTTFKDNYVADNSATWAGYRGMGGGIIIQDSTSQVISNTFESNYGGGFPGEPADYEGWGGGMVITNSITTIQNNQITNNKTGNSPESIVGAGGGIVTFSSTLIIENNTLSGNDASAAQYSLGGSMYLSHSTFTMNGNRINRNTAFGKDFGRGGGIRMVLCPAFTMTNNIIAQNKSNELGSGLGINQSTGTLIHNTIVDNTNGDGSGVCLDGFSNITLYNNIIVSHTIGISVSANCTATLQATLWGSGAWANGTDWDGEGTIITGTINIWGDPAFADPANGDYHIGNDSPAIDAGIDAGVNTDFDGDPRPLDNGFDIGADEHERMYTIYLPLTLKNAK